VGGSGGKGLFVTELIDIITTKSNNSLSSKRPSTFKGSRSGNKKASTSLGNNFHNTHLQFYQDGVNLGEICLVMEFLESDLDQLLKCKMTFNEKFLVKLIYHSLCALAFLHEANVMHRDMKSSNILITPDCNAKICDFGLSRTIP